MLIYHAEPGSDSAKALEELRLLSALLARAARPQPIRSRITASGADGLGVEIASSLSGQHAAFDGQRNAGDVAAGVAGEE